MRALLILITVGFSAAAFAQSPAPKTAKSKAEAKPQTTRAASLWEQSRGLRFGPETAPKLRGLEADYPTEPAARPISPDQKQ
jgi:hypothetical protein